MKWKILFQVFLQSYFYKCDTECTITVSLRMGVNLDKNFGK